MMRHYERADYRHLNDGERYRDYDYLAEDGWTDDMLTSSGAPSSTLASSGPAARASVARASQRERRSNPSEASARPPARFRALLHAALHPRETLQRVAHGVLHSLGIEPPRREHA